MESNGYMKLGDIQGEARDEAHADWIEVLSWNHSLARTTISPDRSTGDGTVERALHHDWSFTKHLDRSTCELNLHCSQGTVFPEATFEVLQSADADLNPASTYKIVMTDVLVSSISINATKGRRPTETVSLSYAAIRWEYTGDRGPSRRRLLHPGEQGAVEANWFTSQPRPDPNR